MNEEKLSLLKKCNIKHNVNYKQRCISMAVNEAKKDGIIWVSGWLR